jgi:osmotically-inducible protein OsmY
VRQLLWDPEVDAGAISVAAKDGTVTLTGAIDSFAGRLAAERAARRVRGVRAVANDIDVRTASGALGRDVHHRIAEAFHRNAAIDARRIAIDVSGGTVILSGHVSTRMEREAAARAAADAPGVSQVENRIAVESRLGDLDERC